MTERAGFGLRSDDSNFSEGRQGARKGVDALRAHAVIIGDENSFH
jgi:hypothetical protein